MRANTEFRDFHRLGLKLKFAYSLTGLLIGLICILAGVVLGLGGVVGHTSFTASLLGLSTSLTDAAPGVIIFVVGVLIILITRFGVRETESRGNGQGTLEYAEPEQAEGVVTFERDIRYSLRRERGPADGSSVVE